MVKTLSYKGIGRFKYNWLFSLIMTIIISLGHERLETTEIYLEKVFAKENHAIHS